MKSIADVILLIEEEVKDLLGRGECDSAALDDGCKVTIRRRDNEQKIDKRYGYYGNGNVSLTYTLKNGLRNFNIFYCPLINDGVHCIAARELSNAEGADNRYIAFDCGGIKEGINNPLIIKIKGTKWAIDKFHIGGLAHALGEINKARERRAINYSI